MADLDLSIGAPGKPEVTAPGDDVDDVEGAADWGDVDDAPEVSPDTVRVVLAAIGAGVGVVAGDEDVPNHWRFTDRELDDLTPPVANIINSRPALRRAVAKGDYAVVAIHLAGYTGRNLGAGKRAREQREDLIGEAGPGVDVGGALAGLGGQREPVGRDGHDLPDLGARGDGSR